MDDRTAKLVLKGIRGLPEREQEHVMVALVRGAFAEPPPLTRSVRQPGTPDVLLLSDAPTMVVPHAAETSGVSAMLPVRLPPELHERLREWSTAQGFSMAGVVRGLVERFLDEQSGASPARSTTAKKPRAKRATPRR
jgi:predicted DNA-binding protein